MVASSELNRRRFLGAITGGVASAVAASAGNRAGEAAEPTFRFGLTPVFLSNDLAVLNSLSAYLAQSTGFAVELTTRRTYQEIAALLVSGQLDAAWICGFPYLQYHDDLELVATPLWRGQPMYQAYYIVSQSRSGVRTIEDTRGDIHAFSDPDSNSGYLVTQAMLARANIDPQSFFRKSFYTYGHRNVIRAVASGLAQSGSVDGYVWEVMRETEPALVEKTRVVWKSDWHGFPPIAAPAGPGQSSKTEVLRNALLAMDKRGRGREVLGMLRLDGFVERPDSIFDSIARNMDLVRRTG